MEALHEFLAMNARVVKLDHVYYRWPRSIYRPLYRPLYRSTVDRLSADSRPTVDCLSADSRSIVGRQSVD